MGFHDWLPSHKMAFLAYTFILEEKNTEHEIIKFLVQLPAKHYGAVVNAGILLLDTVTSKRGSGI